MAEGHAELEQLVAEQTALREVATLVAAGARDVELVEAVTSTIARLFDAQRANTMRWDGDTIYVLGDWAADGTVTRAGERYSYGAGTITAQIVESAAPARVDSLGDLQTDFARARFEELGIHASIGAPILVDGNVWGVITTSRTRPNDPFPPGAEVRLGDFAALVAQAIANSAARRELAALAEEQAALRRAAVLVAGGRSQAEVLEVASREAGAIFDAQAVYLVRWTGVHDEVLVEGGWHDDSGAALEAGALYHPSPGGPTLLVLETGIAQRGNESSLELGKHCAIAAPVIIRANLSAALVALRPDKNPFPPEAEVRLRSFGDLLSQSMANAQAQEEMRASRVRIVQAADDARRKIERDLHDGAQQRLVSVSLTLRAAMATLPTNPEKALEVFSAAAEELTYAIDELREFARGIHPTALTDQGLVPALELLAKRAPLPVAVEAELPERLPPPVEAAAYYVVAESMTNAAKYAEASSVEVRLSRRDGVARVEVVDDGVGGADISSGSGLRGLADRVEALDGRFGVESGSAGTCVWAEIPAPTQEPAAGT